MVWWNCGLTDWWIGESVDCSIWGFVNRGICGLTDWWII